MALEDDATNGGNGTPPSNEVGSLPTNSPATPPIPVQPSAATKPAEAPAQPPALPLSPAAPSRSFMGALAHALIGSTMAVATGSIKAAAGPPAPDSYSTDASGKVTPNYSRRDDTRSRLERLAQHALEGLAAGSQIGPQKSKAAAWGAGLGAGAEAVRQQAQQEDLLKRKQSQEDYDRSQRELTDKAVRAMHNASTFSLWSKAMQEENDHDPERKKNMDVVDAINDYNSRNPGSSMQVQILVPEAAMAMREQDAHSVGKHTFLPLGMTQAKDANGQPLFEADGVTPKQTGQIAVISGGKAGDKIPLPQSFVDDVKEYGKLAQIGGADQLAAGTEVPLLSFINMDKRLNDVKRQEIDGWKNAKVLKHQDGTEVLVNSVTGKVREASPSGAQPSINLQAIQNELNKGVNGERAAEIAAGLQTQIDDPANASMKPVLQKLQTQASTQAEASTKYATGKAGAVAGAEAKAKQQADNKPVYAFNTQTKQLEQTTRNTVAANPTLYTNPVEVKESDIRKDTELARQLGDAQLNLSRYRAAAQKLDSLSLSEQRAVAALVGEDKFKAEFMGAQIPTDWLNKLLTSENWRTLPKTAQDAVIGFIGARGAVIAYQKAVSGSGRANKEQLELELQNIPNPLLPKDVREAQFDRFQQNIDQTGAGLPKMVGIERPKEIQQRIEAEEAQKQGATHVYDPNEKKAVPVRTWIQKHFQGMPGVKP